MHVLERESEGEIDECLGAVQLPCLSVVRVRCCELVIEVADDDVMAIELYPCLGMVHRIGAHWPWGPSTSQMVT